MNDIATQGESNIEVAETSDQRAEAMKMLREVVCKGHTDQEFQFFMSVSRRYDLDPMLKQIYSIKRWSKKEGKEVQVFQVGIDGFRMLAHRTGECAGIQAPTFTYALDKNGKPSRQVETATCAVKRILPSGTIGEFTATVWMSEFYISGSKGSNPFYSTMPHVQLGKVAEVHAIRRAFPIETGGLYAAEEFTAENQREENRGQIEEQVNRSDEKLEALNALRDALSEKTAGQTKIEKAEFMLRVCHLKTWDHAKNLPPSVLWDVIEKIKNHQPTVIKANDNA